MVSDCDTTVAAPARLLRLECCAYAHISNLCVGHGSFVFGTWNIHMISDCDPTFAAPERLLRLECSLFSDVWSLGLVTLELLTGARVFVCVYACDAVCCNVLQYVCCCCNSNALALAMYETDLVIVVLLTGLCLCLFVCMYCSVLLLRPQYSRFSDVWSLDLVTLELLTHMLFVLECICVAVCCGVL